MKITDYTTPQGLAELEKHLYKLTSLRVARVPLECLREYATTAGGRLSSGIGYHKKVGWFVLATAGQGPVIIWSQYPPK